MPMSDDDDKNGEDDAEDAEGALVGSQADGLFGFLRWLPSPLICPQCQ